MSKKTVEKKMRVKKISHKIIKTNQILMRNSIEKNRRIKRNKYRKRNSNPDTVTDDGLFWALMYLCLTVGNGIGLF